MKYISNRRTYLTLEEAKLRDVLLAPQKRRLAEVWGEKYLDYEEIEATKKIKQGKWKLTDEDRDKVINEFFATDYKWVMDTLKGLPEEFVSAVKLCIAPENPKIEYGKDRIKKAFEGEFDIRKLSILQLSCFTNPIFCLISANETKADTKILRDENGRPIMGEDGKMQKVPKEKGEIVLSTNYGNMNTFIVSYNASFPEKKISDDLFTNSNFLNIINMVNDNSDIIDFDLFGNHDLYLLIEHNAVNIMNMSVSKFYKSCQELYFGGGHGTQYMRGLLMNVFDPNSVPAFLVFDTPYYGKAGYDTPIEKLSDFMPFCRRVIRSMEGFNCEDVDTKDPVLHFDQTYPDRMGQICQDMIEKYSHNFRTEGISQEYILAPDIDAVDWNSEVLGKPYMDTLSAKTKNRIGKNTKSIYLSRNNDWSNVIVSQNTVVKEIIIETNDIPSNFFDVKIQSEWIKFKYLTISDFTPFKNVLTDSIAFYQCNLNTDFISQLKEACPNVRKLSFGSVDASLKGLEVLESMEELELIYTITRNSKLEEYVGGIKSLKRLTLSGDLMKNPYNVEYITQLKKNGVTVEIKGLLL